VVISGRVVLYFAILEFMWIVWKAGLGRRTKLDVFLLISSYDVRGDIQSLLRVLRTLSGVAYPNPAPKCGEEGCVAGLIF
jgi:hypothetical protein